MSDKGDGPAGRDQLLQEREELYRRLQDVEKRIARGSRQDQAVRLSKPGMFRPVRGLVLDALDDIGWPTYSRQIAAYAQARYGRSIPATRFGVLMNDEIEAYVNRQDPRRRPRTVWMCPALTWDRAEPIKRLLTRSEWPLERRVFAPTTGRVQYLTTTIRLCEIAMTAGDTAADPETLRILAADHARDLVGIEFRRGHFPLEEWAAIARKLLVEVAERDEEMRRSAAARFEVQLDERSQLFGLPEEVVGVDRPGGRVSAR